jgi:hypothetical protein
MPDTQMTNTNQEQIFSAGNCAPVIGNLMTYPHSQKQTFRIKHLVSAPGREQTLNPWFWAALA